jgi:hypothetical protein
MINTIIETKTYKGTKTILLYLKKAEMTIDNSKFIDELEKRVGEFDYLFQE